MRFVSRFNDILQSLRERQVGRPLGDHLTLVTRRFLGGDRVAVTAVAADQFVVLASSDELARRLDEEQVVVGHGPIFSVLETGTPTVVADVSDDLTLRRWPVFGPILSAAGVGSLLCFPLATGAAHIGAISSYRDTPWSPDPDTYTDGLVLASLTTEIVLQMQAGWVDGDSPDEAGWGLRDRAIVNQAAGMTAERLDIDITEAVLRLRARAFATGQPLAVLARRVVSGETSLET